MEKSAKNFLFQFQNVQKKFHESRAIIESLNLEVPAGQFLSLVGPSGCGKSTILRMIAGLEKPTEGSIEFSHEPPTAFVFQESQLLPWRTVEENILLPLELGSEPSLMRMASASFRPKSPGFKFSSSGGSIHQELDSLLDLVRLSDRRHFFPHQLSGGMKMRVSLARALISRPELLLMDEPFAALDENTRFELQDQLLEICNSARLTVVFVTHSISEAVYLSDRALLLSSPYGKILLDQNLRFDQERDYRLRTNAKYNFYVSLFSEKLHEVSR